MIWSGYARTTAIGEEGASFSTKSTSIFLHSEYLSDASWKEKKIESTINSANPARLLQVSHHPSRPVWRRKLNPLQQSTSAIRRVGICLSADILQEKPTTFWAFVELWVAVACGPLKKYSHVGITPEGSTTSPMRYDSAHVTQVPISTQHATPPSSF